MVVLPPSICDSKNRVTVSTCNSDNPSTRPELAPGTSTAPSPPSTMDSLPLEIIHEIFVLCLPENFRLKSNGRGPTAPLQLCHVSQAWRRAAICEPRLWRNLMLPTKRLERVTSLESFSEGVAKITAQAVFWLENAGDAGIRLVFDIPRPLFETANTATSIVPPRDVDLVVVWSTFVAAVLVKRAPRIRSLEMQPFPKVPSSCIAPFLAPDSPQNFKRLESVFLVGSNLNVNSCLGCQPKGLFTNAPNLKKAALVFTTITSSPTVPGVLPDNLLPWGQLTHIMIKVPCSGSFWKRVLLQCTQLETCVMHLEHCIVDSDCGPPLSSSGIQLPRLNRLDATFHDEYSSPYFHDFHFPNLESFILACDIGNGFPTFTWLPVSKPYFSAQLRRLKSFTLSYQTISSSDLLDLLRETGELEELVVDSYLMDHKGFLKALTLYPDQTTSPIVPNLKTFGLYLEYYAETPPTTFEEEDLLVMMASRSMLASELARHVCVRHSLEVEGIYSAKDPGGRRFPPDRLISSSLGSVELWVDNEEGVKFGILEKFQVMAEACEKESEGKNVTLQQELIAKPFSFLLDFNSPSEWLVQSNEPVWYRYN